MRKRSAATKQEDSFGESGKSERRLPVPGRVNNKGKTAMTRDQRARSNGQARNRSTSRGTYGVRREEA